MKTIFAWVVASIVLVSVLVVTQPAEADCTPWDVRSLCCPSACATRASPRWPEADRVLRGCMAGLGCGDTRDATVAVTCECK